MEIDVSENKLQHLSAELLLILLKDQTMSAGGKQQNIFWATSDYEPLGEGYGYFSQITPALITGQNGKIISPRVLKTKNIQTTRVRDMAEVFTPSWICNEQNNLVDAAWFGGKSPFNVERLDENGRHFWNASTNKISFPKGRSWESYVRDPRIEVACGEAPYIVSRYDTTTGKSIPIGQRIGLLDRKLRIVSENTEISTEWIKWAKEAFKSIYAYEWQGDNLLVARENMLISFIEYHHKKFGKYPSLRETARIAQIISWNVWQMDGLKGVVPETCTNQTTYGLNLFGEEEAEVVDQCEGCRKNDIYRHNGRYCLIKDWQASKNGKTIRFVDLMRG